MVFSKMVLGVNLALLVNQEVPCWNLIHRPFCLRWIVPALLTHSAQMLSIYSLSMDYFGFGVRAGALRG